MEQSAQYEFLDKPLKELHLSPEFYEVLIGNGITSIRELVEKEAYQLLELPGFGYRMMHEFISLLKNYGLIHLLKE